MTMLRRLAVYASVLLTLANQAQAATYYYYRGGAQPSETTGTKPPSPAPDGTFAILVDGPSPDVAIRGSSYSATTYAYGNAGQVVFSIAAGRWSCRSTSRCPRSWPSRPADPATTATPSCRWRRPAPRPREARACRAERS